MQFATVIRLEASRVTMSLELKFAWTRTHPRREKVYRDVMRFSLRRDKAELTGILNGHFIRERTLSNDAISSLIPIAL